MIPHDLLKEKVCVVTGGAQGIGWATAFFRKHISASRLPRLTDFIPYLTPPEVAAGIFRAIRDRRPILNLQCYLAFFYFLYALAPGTLHWLTSVSGSGQRQYGEIEWRYWQAKRKDQAGASR